MNGDYSKPRTAADRRTWRLQFLASAVAALLVAFSIYLYARQSTALRNAVERTEATTQLQAEVTSALVERIESDMPALSGLPVVAELLLNPSDERFRDIAAHTLTTFVSSKGIYDQARILDDSGWEVLRVNRLGTNAEIVPPDHLQDKSNRYYVREGLAAPEGSWYVSAFDLNVENGEIEEPRKPMIRLAAPVVVDDRTIGLVVLNLLGDVVLQSYRDATAGKPGVVGLADENGWWLFVDDPSREWGNMYPGQPVDSVEQTLGALWDEIRSVTGVTTVTRDLVVSTWRIAPFRGAVAAASVGKWYIINHPTKRELGVDLASVFRDSIPVFLIALFFVVAASWLLANATYDRNRYRSMIERAAYVDDVTDTPNRRYLMDQLEREIDVLGRYGHHFSILFLDLDGFKAVNDSIGHDAGDEVLREVARRLVRSVRKSDTVARLGGDEFVVLLVATPDKGPADTVASKILKAIQQPISLGKGDARVGTSIGVAWSGDTDWSSENDCGAEHLLRIADKAMYRAKRGGKNRIAWA